MTKFNETEAGADFIATGNSRETDPRIMRAIAFFARDLAEAEKIWEGDFGGACSVLDIWENATNNGLIDATNLCWGASGSTWADGV